ncbi:hypothetical protein DACRYDRAFT_60093 [Dacryopinax primogenitus]|uniref:Small ribosomal subunit protein mS35 mitochondrial conserved domain-containing protein n=1 Tax=Dacryopinax primogenitus (strain DJM 731) TaxID=1858805 RepID=M5FZ01_DACPD|nr:uncharacterized protein DACRYDRAFT_60093 [Dacryopinax primogenitus]EJT96702.1 hypothetical protein DACRYDRAFT_60093 [Dacryopinax primogenitus]
MRFFRDFGYDDIPSVGHDMLGSDRQYVEYMRYIEVEGPELEKYRQPFVPQTLFPLRIRTFNYNGEQHPATRKVVLTCPVSCLSLPPAALHKLKLLSGARWSPYPPTDAGVTPEEQEKEGGEGWIKISCEMFPEPLQNSKWCSDKLDLLVMESQRNPTYFLSVPLDTRHIHARERKHPRHTHLRRADFPLEWIPEGLREEARSKREARPLGEGRLPFS